MLLWGTDEEPQESEGLALGTQAASGTCGHLAAKHSRLHLASDRWAAGTTVHLGRAGAIRRGGGLPSLPLANPAFQKLISEGKWPEAAGSDGSRRAAPDATARRRTGS